LRLRAALRPVRGRLRRRRRPARRPGHPRVGRSALPRARAGHLMARVARVPVSLVNVRTRDGITLAGLMTEPRRRRGVALIWVHGLGSTFASGQALVAVLARRLGAAGIAYLKLDTRGHHVVARTGKRLA